MRPSAVFIAFFDFLDDTHRDIQRHIGQLHKLVDAIGAGGLSPAQRAQLREVIGFFNGEARQHPLDQERLVFPVLLASEDADTVQAAERLTQDHGWLEENWLHIEPCLEAAVNGNAWFDPVELQHALQVFEALYTDHILFEEAMAYPEARQRLAAAPHLGSGREMAKRRAAATA